MEKNNKNQLLQQDKLKDKYLKLRFAAIILIVVAAGLFVINQALEYHYKAEFLKKPCKLCGELNPEVQNCITELNKPRPSYWTHEGWTDPFNETTKYNITINNNLD